MYIIEKGILKSPKIWAQENIDNMKGDFEEVTTIEKEAVLFDKCWKSLRVCGIYAYMCVSICQSVSVFETDMGQLKGGVEEAIENKEQLVWDLKYKRETQNHEGQLDNIQHTLGIGILEEEYRKNDEKERPY